MPHLFDWLKILGIGGVAVVSGVLALIGILRHYPSGSSKRRLMLRALAFGENLALLFSAGGARAFLLPQHSSLFTCLVVSGAIMTVSAYLALMHHMFPWLFPHWR